MKPETKDTMHFWAIFSLGAGFGYGLMVIQCTACGMTRHHLYWIGGILVSLIALLYLLMWLFGKLEPYGSDVYKYQDKPSTVTDEEWDRRKR